jgi:DNA modification methylase
MSLYFEDKEIKIYCGDVIEVLSKIENNSIQCCVTSPPYWGLRDYGISNQIGLEKTPNEYVNKMVQVFREVYRVLKDDGTLWLNLGDSYAGSGKGSNSDGSVHPSALTAKQGTHKGTTEGIKPLHKVKEIGLKPKDLVGIPWRVAFALQADGWYLRQDIIWHKPNPMPESVRDRCTKAHEYIFLFSKSKKYYFDAKSIEEDAKWERWGNQTEKKKHSGTAKHLGGKLLAELPIRNKKNKRSVWSVSTKPFKGAHFATFPPDLIEPCVLAGCPEGGVVLDPFSGSGTTAMVARNNGRKAIGIEINKEYCDISLTRIENKVEKKKIK